jgi:hypothetical protein
MLTVSFVAMKSAVMRFLFIFIKLTILKILSCFAPNLTPVCEPCVLTYSHSFDVFYVELKP